MKKATSFNKEQIYKLESSIDHSEGSVVSKQIIKREKGTVSLFSFAEGEGLSEHTAPFDALVQIITGNAEIKIAGKSHFLKAGEIIIMPAGIPHALHASSSFKMLLTMIRE